MATISISYVRAARVMAPVSLSASHDQPSRSLPQPMALAELRSKVVPEAASPLAVVYVTFLMRSS